EGCGGRVDPRPGRVAMDMGEERLHPRNERLAVEQLADGDGGIERAGIGAAPCPRAQVGVEIGGRGDAAGEHPRTRLHEHRFGRGGHVKARGKRRYFARTSPVAGGIFEADDAGAKRIDESLDQSDVPRQAGLGGEVIKINGDWFRGRGGHNRLDIGGEAVIRHALVVERRKDERPGEAELGGVPCQRDRGGDPRCPRANHEAIERQPRPPQGRRHALALLKGDGGGRAGGAEHVQPVAARAEQKPRQRHRAGAIRFPRLVHGGRDGGNHALKLAAGGHVASCLRANRVANCDRRRAPCYSTCYLLSAPRYSLPRHPLTLNAASAAILTSWASLAESGTICTDRSSPTRIGPITVAPPSSCSSLVEIEAEWNAGMISTFAGPESRQNGYAWRSSMLSATSGAMSPSYSKSTRR